MLGISQAHAFAMPLNVERFQQENASVDQLITFTYSELGVEGFKTMTIPNNGKVTQEVIAHDSMSTTPADDLGIMPIVKSVWDTNAFSLLNTGYNYTGTKYLLQWATMDAGMANISVCYTDVTENASRLTQISGLTGYTYSVTLLPPQDVANYYCQKYGYTLQNITAINYTSSMINVDYLVIEQSEPMQADNDLSNGYQGLPVSAPLGELGAQLAKYLVTAIVAIILICGVTWGVAELLGYHKPPSNPVTQEGSSVTIIINGTNGLDLWNQYVTAMEAINVTPTVSGFPSSFDLWCQAIGLAQPKIYINAPTNNTYTPPTQPKTLLTDILAFLADLGPLIISIIIIVAFIFGFILIVKVIRTVKSYIPEPRKQHAESDDNN